MKKAMRDLSDATNNLNGEIGEGKFKNRSRASSFETSSEEKENSNKSLEIKSKNNDDLQTNLVQLNLQRSSTMAPSAALFEGSKSPDMKPMVELGKINDKFVPND